MESVRPASTIMLVRNSKDNIEILMVRRNTKSVFGNLYVFPGGKVDIDDRSEELYSLSRNLDDVDASRALGMQKDGLAYWVAGLRECFEEVGILLHDASQIIDHQLKVNQRTELNNGKTNFLDICKAQKLNLPTDSMIPISHWITPEVEVKRFDTWFFLMHYQGDQQSNHDGIELTNSSWINPQEALDACSSGKMNMIIPTIKNLEKLVPFKRVEDAIDFFKEKVSSIPSILPKFEKQDGHWNFVIPENSD